MTRATPMRKTPHHSIAASLVLATALLTPGSSLANDDEPSELQETEPAVRSEHPRLQLDLALSYGVSYLDSMVSAGLPFDRPLYLEVLDVELSTNVLRLDLLGAYALTEGGAQLIFSLPAGVVQQAVPGGRLLAPFDGSDFEFAVGDLTAGLAYPILRQRARRPDLVLQVLGSTGSAKFVSLGDGFASVEFGLAADKQVTPAVSVGASGTYEHRFDRDGVVAGEVVGLATSVSTLTRSGAHRVEAQVGANRVGATGLPRDFFLPADDPEAAADSTLYYLAVGLRRAGTRHQIMAFLVAPEGEFGIRENSFGLAYSMPLLPRERGWVRRGDRS